MTFRRSAYLFVSSALAVVVVTVPLAAGADVREGASSVNITVTTKNGVRELPPEEETHLRVFTHEERPSHRLPAPVCQPTQNDGVATYALTGWHLPAGGFSYVVNTERAPDDIQDAVAAALTQAAGTWGSADADKALTFLGASDISRPRYDGQNVVLWKRLPRSTIAAAYIWYDPVSGEVVDADVVLSTRVPWAMNDPNSGDCAGSAGAYDVRAVATHEFGHWLGLDDLYESTDADLTMHGIVTVAELKKASLGAGDVDGALAVAP